MILSLTLVALATGPPATALERLVDHLEPKLAGLAPPVAVWVDGPSALLARTVASQVATRLASRRLAPVVIEAQDAAQAEMTARAQSTKSLVRLTVELTNGQLTARGDTLSTWVNFFSGRVPTRSAGSAVVVASVEADTETLALESPRVAPQVIRDPASPWQLEASVLATLGAVPAALATADLDGDRRAEVLVLANEEVLVYDAQGQLLGRHDLSLGPPAKTPTREPFGALGVQGLPARAVVVAWSGRRERAAAISWAGGFRASTPADALLVEGVSLKPDDGFNRFRPDLTWGGKPVTLDAPPQAVSTRGSLALVVWGDGTAALLRGSLPEGRLVGVGCGSTLADLDGDGAPEVVTSSTRVTDSGDDLRVLSLASAEALQARRASPTETNALWQGTTPTGRVVVAAAADLDGDRAEEVVLGSWLQDGTGQLLVLKRVGR